MSSRPSLFTRLFSLLRRPAVVGGGTLLLVALFVLWWKVGNLYPVKGFVKQWRADKFMVLAQEQVALKKYPEASRILQNILRDNPSNLDAWKLRLKVAEGEDDKRAVAATLYQIVKLQPGQLETRIRLVKLLVDARDLKNSAEVLAGVPAAQADRPEVLRLGGEIAMASNETVVAQKTFRALLKLVPDDKGARFNLAALALNGQELLALNEARDTLRGFLADPEYRLASLRLLLAAAIRTNSPAEIREFTHRLAGETSITFADRLLLLSGQRLTEKPAYDRSLEELKREAETEAEKATQLAGFFVRNRMFTEAEKFLGSLPEDMASKPEISYALSDALFGAKDWPTLEQKLKTANWDRADYMRLAFLAYAYRMQPGNEKEPGHQKEFDETWNLALIGADPEPANVRRLLGQAERWGWTNEVTALLWKLFQRDPNDEDIYRQLVEKSQTAGNTASLQRVFTRRLEAKPDDKMAKNNAAYLGLLLGTGTNQAQRYAREVYDADPKNPFYATTQALALLKQHKAADALKVFEELTPEQRTGRERAMYYAAVLQAAGRTADAKAVLPAKPPLGVLPEERAIYDQTKQAIEEAPAGAK